MDITTQGSDQYVQDVESKMDEFYELIGLLKEVEDNTGFQFSIRRRSKIASGAIEFSLNIEDATWDMTNCREAIGFLEGFQAHHMLRKTQ